MRGGLTSDGIILVVQDEDVMCDMLKLIAWGVCREEIVPNEETKSQEGLELECPAIACALGVFSGPKAEVEPQLDQVGDMPGFGVKGGGCRGHDGVEDAQGSGILPLDWGIFDLISLELSGEALFQADVSLGVGGVSRVGEAIQEVGRCNCPPCLINQLFPNSVHLALGLLVVTGPVPVESEEFDARDE